jgi:hypothetical protein
MIERINKTEEIRTELVREGKVSFLDKPEQKEAMLKLNDGLLEDRRRFKVMEKNSFETSSRVVLTS